MRAFSGTVTASIDLRTTQAEQAVRLRAMKIAAWVDDILRCPHSALGYIAPAACAASRS